MGVASRIVPLIVLVLLLSGPAAIGLVWMIATLAGHDDGAAFHDIFLAGFLLLVPAAAIVPLRERAHVVAGVAAYALAAWGVFLIVGGVLAAIAEALG